MCDRGAIIGRGRILAQDTLDNLAGGLGDTRRVRLRAAGPEEKIERVLSALPGLRALEPLGAREPGAVVFIVEFARAAARRGAASTALAAAGCPVVMMRPMDMDLEDIFLRLTGGGDA